MTNNLTPKQSFMAALSMLAGTFGREMSGPAIEGYWRALEDLEPEEFAAATKRALEVCKFMPTPAELREFAGKVPGKAGLTVEMAEAWEAVRWAMDKYDYTHSVDFGPLVNAIVRNLGGWYALCDKSIPDLVWVRKDFERLYEAYKSKPPEHLNGGHLVGQFGGPVHLVPIGGKLPQRQIEDGRAGEVADLIRRLADGKSA